ncbi:MAG: DUF3093 domain-containing protein [Actinomycetia bacterium]|nr:DUF3093 domain-containing protein [Actinomycetes bacterium]
MLSSEDQASQTSGSGVGTTTEPAATHPVYRERLFPRPWVWLALVAFVGALAMAYAYAWGATSGWAVFLAGSLVSVLMLFVTAPRIEVSSRELRAGKARLPIEYVGKVAALDKEQTESVQGPKSDPAAYLLIRPLAASRSVIVELTDEVDPHPYWLLSTRNAQALSAALVAVRPTYRPA